MLLDSIMKRLGRAVADHPGPARRALLQTARTTGMAGDRAVLRRSACRAERAVLTNPTLCNRVTLHVTAEESHRALLAAIREAERSFYVETFIWHNDAAGNEVIAALAERLARAKAEGRPFEAKVLIDWLGLRNATGGVRDVEVVAKLRAAGVEVLEFADGYVHHGKLLPITHRKFYIQDERKFITGGRNIGDEYLKPRFTHGDGPAQPAWHDLLYTVEGDEAGRVVEEFQRNWRRAGGEASPLPPQPVPHPTGRARIQSFLTDPHEGVRTLHRAHLELVANAEREIVAIYPYLSDDALMKALIAAKRENPALSIKVMLPANKEAGAEGTIFALVNRASARELLRHGVEVRLVGGGEQPRFSHFKGLMIDGEVLSLGSANADARTFRANHELNTVIADPSTAADFRRRVVDPDWAAAEPLTAAALATDSPWLRLKQRVLELFDFLL